MRIAEFSRIALLAVIGALFALVTYARQDPSQQPAVDPVAEAAKKARAQQKTEPKPKKVYTNDDFASSSKPAPTTNSSAPAEKKEGDADQADADKDKKQDAKGEEFWRKSFASTREKLANAEKELDILQRELEKSELQYYPDPQKAMVQQFNRSDINDKRAKIDAKQKEIAALKQQLSDMEDDLRKAGGNPGWAR
jgi:chromosome segregation ATPase